MIKDAKHAQQFIGNNQEERPKGDFYPSPPIAVEQLLDRVSFTGLVWEPACGNGVISEVLKKRGLNVYASDLYDWGYGDATGRDFLTGELMDVDAVITNPPFNIPRNAAYHFAIRALAATKARQGKVAFLQRIQWLEGKKRKPLFEQYPFSQLLVFSGRLPRMNRYDFEGKSSSSMMAFAWYIWDWKHEGAPTIGWI